VDRGTTVLLASHRLADVQAATERLLVLQAGRIVFDGTMPELWRQVGAATTLWVRVPPGARDAAREQLRAECRLRPVVANGAALGVRVEHAAGADVLVALRQAAIPVEDFWTESPSLHDLLDGILVRGGHS
jgi:ABC-2 type transport system ATP-binding protein